MTEAEPIGLTPCSQVEDIRDELVEFGRVELVDRFQQRLARNFCFKMNRRHVANQVKVRTRCRSHSTRSE